MGEKSQDLIVINTVVPFLYAYGLHRTDERMCDRAGRFLEELKAENNHIIRSWGDAGLPVGSAADSQAFIQLRKEYCDKRKCLFAVSDTSICGRNESFISLITYRLH